MRRRAVITMLGTLRRPAAAALVLACVVPVPAHAVTLDCLLAKPIECLLHLTVTPARAAGERDA